MDTIEEYQQFKIVRDGKGLLGLIYYGEVIEPCEYNEISRMDRYFLCRKSGCVKHIGFNSIEGMVQTSAPPPKEEVVANGYIVICNDMLKYGLLSPDREEILPPEYDNLFKWKDCNVVAARKGDQVKYFNTAGKQILTCIRHIDGATDWLYPYYIGEPQTNVVQLMDLTSNCEGDDFCECYGFRAGLSRRLHSEHAAYLQSLANVVPFRKKEIESFLADDCYIFASFAFDSENGIVGCINRWKEIECYRSGWSWMYLVLFQDAPTPKDIEQTKWAFKCLGEDNSYNSVDGLAFGVSDSVNKGVKLIATRYFRDHWPTEEEWDYMSRGDVETMRELKRFFKGCRANRQRNLNRTFRNIIETNEEETSRSGRWRWKKKRMELCLRLGANMPGNAVNELIISYSCQPSLKSIIMKTLVWVIKHGADVNRIFNSETPLDIIEQLKPIRKRTEKDIKAFRRLLLDHKALHAKEIRTDVCAARGINAPITFGDTVDRNDYDIDESDITPASNAGNP